jgi:hypothetical protein
VFPKRYEHNLHIQIKGIPVTGRGGPQVFPVKYEHDLNIESEVIPVIGSGGLRVFFL